MNTPSTILSAIPRRLHIQPNHPLTITRQLIESRFPGYKTHNTLFPIVTTGQNFDSLGFPQDHVGRSRTDTYYINKDTVLRTHTSAHQADVFRANESEGYLISADVYRRDAIDRTHYPIFHQMEGARTWSRQAAEKTGKSLAEVIYEDVARIPKHNIQVEDPDTPFHASRNPKQDPHSVEEVAAVATHLKRSLEDVVVTIFDAARQASSSSDPSSPSAAADEEPLKMRWVEAYFPFTSPSWELEVFWQGDWLEVLGSGVVQQAILNSADVPDRLGWAFGLGLERIAMLLYGIPDIRLFWSTDARFLSQFDADAPLKRFVPFSKYPACFKDVSFWLPAPPSPSSSNSAAGGAGTLPPSSSSSSPSAPRAPSAPPSTTAAAAAPGSPAPASPSSPPPPSPSSSPTAPAIASAPLTGQAFHENDVMEIARDVCGDVVEDVRLVDEFVHPKSRRRSLCYRVNYRSLERTLTNDETNALHQRLEQQLVEKLGVEIR
ncbi:phenylalanyl-tRNA synthetase mitochondrial precursor [Periconia macrospinosa]|uniref:Phenylalanine--tRNA ligase, mitochondrial n=1 Tax=Periconia macrospinosa TaxID=97972 RepID=A0A2V1E9R3_9PLEO|nr:phenylalanyl-tRNA synthetase mitochondrial precursor [Periconia macrospinosa]